ncbi:MAG: DNA alkylation repair protein [bacterium]|nr:DNA alkylation repair protein [bacterium]
MKVTDLLRELLSMQNQKNVEGMKRFAIGGRSSHLIGISIYELRKIAKTTGKDHGLALQLWNARHEGKPVHEARLLASLTADPEQMAPELMDDWISEFESWDLCDQMCSNLFDKTHCAHEKAMEWSYREREFEKRSGFVMMACLSVHDKNASEGSFEPFFKRALEESFDERNFVKKAVNWAIRQIGKRNAALNKRAIEVSEEILSIENKTAKWIARGALRELRSEKVQKRLEAKK